MHSTQRSKISPHSHHFSRINTTPAPLPCIISHIASNLYIHNHKHRKRYQRPIQPIMSSSPPSSSPSSLYYRVPPEQMDFTTPDYLIADKLCTDVALQPTNAANNASNNKNNNDNNQQQHHLTPSYNITTPIQNEIYHLLTTHNILTHLKDFHPIIAGTIPINIETPTSDIDLILTTTDLIALQQLLVELFGEKYEAFTSNVSDYKGEEVLLCSFQLPNDHTMCNNNNNDKNNNNNDSNNRNNNTTSQHHKCVRDYYEVEIFAQHRHTTQQNAYLHMIKEYAVLWYYETILQDGGAFRSKVLELKSNGVKTEPAFAQLLGLTEGSPYDALLEYQLPPY